MLIQVALPVPLYRVFDYLPLGEDLPVVGARVQVPFGAGNRQLVGVVVGLVASSDLPLDRLKQITAVIDDEPLLDEGLLALAVWLASYYHYPLGDVIAVMLPTLLRAGQSLESLVRHWRLNFAKLEEQARADGVSVQDFVPKFLSNKKHRQQFMFLVLNGERGASEEFLHLEGLSRAFLKKLHESGWLELFFEEPPEPKAVELIQAPLPLNEEQKNAVYGIKTVLESGDYQGILLNGVTGSGKTEVYLQAMQNVLESRRQVLVLVPEIGLTPQTKMRFANRFSGNLVLLHSRMSDADRMRGWRDCQTGRAQIIIGTRSAILYPFANLGLIIVDEAHDLSYKQQDTLRYNATDVALYRGFLAKIPVVLGTATPTLEQLKLVMDGKLHQYRLTVRAGHAKPAKMQLVDARVQDKHYQLQTDGKMHQVGLTQAVIHAMRQTLEAGKQVLVFLNRRGFAPVLLCASCGWQANCPRCDAHLTVHQHTLADHLPSFLQCHHCGWQTPLPHACPECKSHNLDTIGLGTTRLSEHLHAIFANPQASRQVYPIIQIDRDTTRKKNSWETIYQQISLGDPAILVGTQMVAKGHHFPNVTLVVLPEADRGFLSADFRSPEHTAQMIVQVAGRAGRGDKAGRVLIQTVQPDNPLLLTLVKDGYQALAEFLLSERKLLGLPPYRHTALIRCEARTLEKANALLDEATHQLNQIYPINHEIRQGISLLKTQAPMGKKNNRFHMQLFISAQNRTHLHTLLKHWWPAILNLPHAKYLKLTLDVDPIGWY